VSTLCRSCTCALIDGLGINQSERAMTVKTTVVQTLAMAAPSLRYIQDMDEGMWEIVYALTD
jgi:hypothetical protein